MSRGDGGQHRHFTTMEDRGSNEDLTTATETPSAKRLRLCKQILIVLVICLTFIVFAFSGGWTNPALSDMNNDKTTVYGTNITLEPWEADMIGSLMAVGMVPGAWTGSWMGTRLGRRHSLMALQVPAILGWILIAFAYNPIMILVGRVLHGINSGATGVIGNSFIVEVSDTAYRGTLASLAGVFISLGTITVLSFGFILRWFELPYIGIALSILVTILLVFIPESPTYLALSGKKEEARRILASLRGPAVDLEMEMEIIRKMNENKAKGSLFPTLLKSGLWRSVLVICLLMFFQNFGGYIVVLNFTTRIFIEAGTAVDDKVAALLAILVLTVGFLSSLMLIDKFGRKKLLVVSTFLIALFSFSMGTYYYFKNADTPVQVSVVLHNSNASSVEAIKHTNYTLSERTAINSPPDDTWWWVPVVCVMGIAFSGSLGIGPVPWILSAEYFPTSVRPMCMGITSTVVSIWSFASLQLYSPLVKAFGTSGLFWFYGGISLLAVVFCLTCVSETKDKAVG